MRYTNGMNWRNRMKNDQEGNIVDLVNHKYQEKTWSIQIRVDPCALAELALYFDQADGTVRTKSMLGAVIVETLRMVLRDNEMLGESVTDVLRAMEIFNELGYQLQAGGRFARARISKTLKVREGFIQRIDRDRRQSALPLDQVDEEMDKVVEDELVRQRAAIDKKQVDEMKKELATPQEDADG